MLMGFQSQPSNYYDAEEALKVLHRLSDFFLATRDLPNNTDELFAAIEVH